MAQLHDLSLSSAACPHVAFLVLPLATRAGSAGSAARVGADWLTACYQLTQRVERLSPRAVTLDLGICTDREAQRVLHGLVQRLDNTLGLAAARVGVGPTAVLAQLAVLTAAPRQRLVSIAPAEAVARIGRVPVSMLAQLLPRGAITAETVARLQRYGLYTLGHIATLPEQVLRQQFGSAAGAALSAFAWGHDPLPFCPTPAPQRLHFRMRCVEAASPQRVLAALPAWTKQIAATLQHAQLAVRALQLVVGWDDGRRLAAGTVMRQHVQDAETLLATVRGLLLPVLQPEEDVRDARPAGAALLDTVRLTALDVAPHRPAQGTFWQARTSRQAALGPIAEALTRRYGRPLVLCAQPAAPAAIFPEECYRLAAVAGDLAHVRKTEAQVTLSISRRTASTMTDWETVPHRLHWW